MPPPRKTRQSRQDERNQEELLTQLEKSKQEYDKLCEAKEEQLKSKTEMQLETTIEMKQTINMLKDESLFKNELLSKYERQNKKLVEEVSFFLTTDCLLQEAERRPDEANRRVRADNQLSEPEPQPLR